MNEKQTLIQIRTEKQTIEVRARNLRTNSRYHWRPVKVVWFDVTLPFRVVTRVIVEDERGNIWEFDSLREAAIFILWSRGDFMAVPLSEYDAIRLLQRIGVEVKYSKTLEKVEYYRALKDHIDVREVKELTVTVGYHHTGNLYSDSYDIIAEFKDGVLKVVKSGRFSRVAEVGYKQVYDEYEVDPDAYLAKVQYRGRTWYVALYSEILGSGTLAVFVRDGAKWRCFVAERVPIRYWGHNSYTGKSSGILADVVLKREYSSITNFSGIERVYSVERRVLEIVLDKIIEKYKL